MLKTRPVLEVVGKEDRKYRLELDGSSPLGEVHDALYTMLRVIVEEMQKIREKGAPDAENPIKEENKETVDA